MRSPDGFAPKRVTQPVLTTDWKQSYGEAAEGGAPLVWSDWGLLLQHPRHDFDSANGIGE
jgi:hypothetical protein